MDKEPDPPVAVIRQNSCHNCDSNNTHLICKLILFTVQDTIANPTKCSVMHKLNFNNNPRSSYSVNGLILEESVQTPDLHDTVKVSSFLSLIPFTLPL